MYLYLIIKTTIFGALNLQLSQIIETLKNVMNYHQLWNFLSIYEKQDKT